MRETLLQIPELLSIQMSHSKQTRAEKSQEGPSKCCQRCCRWNIQDPAGGWGGRDVLRITALMLDFASRPSTRTFDSDRVQKADSRRNKLKM